jgi:hypothetical protein
MGQEVFEQNQQVAISKSRATWEPARLTPSPSLRLISEIDEHVDSTSSRLAKAQNRMDRFVREHSEHHLLLRAALLMSRSPNCVADSGSNWCIFILMILLALLLFVILFM